MSFYFSPLTRDRFKNFRKSFSESLSKTTSGGINSVANNTSNNHQHHQNSNSSSGTSSSSSFTRAITNPLRNTIVVSHQLKTTTATLLTKTSTTTTNTTSARKAPASQSSSRNNSTSEESSSIAEQQCSDRIGDERTTVTISRAQVIEKAEVNPLRLTMMPSVKSRLIKNISRTKEKILQGMGKTDRTEDENFDLYVENFERQYAQANKLNKELNKYLSCMRETHKASRMFYETLKETYEAQWPQASAFSEQVDSLETKWTEYLNQLYKDVQLPLMAYLNEFPELKKKIEKRCNRLLDYDNARHSLESAHSKTLKKGVSAPFANMPMTMTMNTNNSSSNNNNNNSSSSSSSSSNSASQHNTSGGGGMSASIAAAAANAGNTTSTGTTATAMATTEQLTKLTKLKIDLEDKQHMYEEMNQTLCMALPVLFDNRVKFYSSLFQTLFHTETEFHSESAECKSRLDEICESLSLLKSETLSPSSLEKPPGTNGTSNHHHRNMVENGRDYHGFPSAHMGHDIQALNGGAGGGGGGSGGGADANSDEEVDHSHLNHMNNHHHHNHNHRSSHHDNGNHHGDNDDIGRNTATVSEFVPKPSLNDNYSSSSEDIRARNGLDDDDQESRVSGGTSYHHHHHHPNGIVGVVGGGGGGGGGMVTAGETTTTTSQQQQLGGGLVTTTTTTVHKDKVMYRVRATYPYEAKELDELTFTKEDLIMVIEGTESEKEDLDDGWLIGIHEITNKRGLFPENFTKRII